DHRDLHSFPTRRSSDLVYLGSAELAAICALLGKIPTKQEYLDLIPKKIEGKESQIYRYLNFNLIEDYTLV
ncbi:hypothetical protein, partial [Helicobacter ganmani]|uniref:hypothetical protein n=1 Tax=Helicobacter ganmani TaxID=60246 RepID=UPI003A8A1487